MNSLFCKKQIQTYYFIKSEYKFAILWEVYNGVLES